MITVELNLQADGNDTDGEHYREAAYFDLFIVSDKVEGGRAHGKHLHEYVFLN